MIDDWWRSESATREAVRARETEIAELTEVGFALLGEGMDALEKKPLDPWELVIGFAVTQLHNTLRTSRELAFAGYGVQALALARLADEFLVLLWWMPNHRDQAPAWLDPKDTTRKTAGAMAKDVFASDPETGEHRRELHESLHRFAHQDALAFTAIYTADEKTAGIQIGPCPDPGQLRGAAFYLMTYLALGADTMAKVVEAPPDVAKRVTAYVDRVDEWRERTDREEHARLTALGITLPALEET